MVKELSWNIIINGKYRLENSKFLFPLGFALAFNCTILFEENSFF